MLCKYRNIFGEPNKGIHSIRLGGVALVDLLLTVLLAILLGWWLSQNILLMFLILMLLTIILHRIFCVNTALNVAIFGNVK